jgi:hypothetical protein
MVTKAQLTIVDDLTVGDWIRDGLLSWNTRPFPIGICIPAGFESYVLIRPKSSEDNSHQIGLTPISDYLEILADFTTTPEDCFHALWEGHGWLNSGVNIFMPIKHPIIFRIAKTNPFNYLSSWTRKIRRGRRTFSVNEIPFNTLPEGIWGLPRFQLPYRDYLLMRGPLREALNIGSELFDHFSPETPNLIWPKDKSWIFVKEIDYSVVLVGGSQKMIRNILFAYPHNAEKFRPIDPVADLNVGDQ